MKVTTNATFIFFGGFMKKNTYNELKEEFKKKCLDHNITLSQKETKLILYRLIMEGYEKKYKSIKIRKVLCFILIPIICFLFVWSDSLISKIHCVLLLIFNFFQLKFLYIEEEFLYEILNDSKEDLEQDLVELN